MTPLRRSESELRWRIKELFELEDRLDQRDWFKRNWVVDYSVDACIIAEALEALLDDKGEPIASRWHLKDRLSA